MKINKHIIILSVFFVSVLCLFSGCIDEPPEEKENFIEITDSAGRVVSIPENPERIAVSGSGSMRYFVYLDIDLEKVAIVDFLDSKDHVWARETRPYILARPEILKKDPIGSSGASVDNEKLLASNAQVLFISTGFASRQNADDIQEKTGIPVVMYHMGNYVTEKEKIDDTLRMLAKIFKKEKRCEEVIKYFGDIEKDLKSRVPNIDDDKKPTVYIAGVSYRGSHGMDGTDPMYHPFEVLEARNVASESTTAMSQTGYIKVSKEKILEWDPDIIFVDLATLSAAEGGAIVELKNDPTYNKLSAVKNNQIYTVNPHTAMFVNHETTLANAYFVGKVLYPENFKDIDPAEKADEIYKFVDGGPVFDQLNKNLGNMSYQNIRI